MTKQCPFCAYDQTRIETTTSHDSDHWEYRMLCLNCGAYGPNDMSESRAIKSWNMRRETYLPDERSDLTVQVDADAYEDLRNATPEELLAAVEWFTRQSIQDPWGLEQGLAFLRMGFDVAQPGGWERVAPIWLWESRKIAALDAKGE